MRPRLTVLAVSALLALTGPIASATAQPMWRAPVVLDSAPSQIYPPRVAVEDDGGAVVAWARGGPDPAVWARVRPSADAPFGPLERLSAPCGPSCLFYGLQVAMNASGDAVAAWLASAAVPVAMSTVQATSRPAGGAFAPAEDLSGQRSTVQAFPAVAITDGGRALVAFSRDDGVMRIRSRSGTGPWGADAVLGGAPILNGGLPSLSVGGGGHAAVAWPVAACSALIARADPAGAWGAPEALGPGSTCTERPVVAVDASGAVDAAWAGWDGYVRRMMVARAPLGGSFGQAADLGPAVVSILQPDVVRSLAGGDALVGWNDGAYRPVIARRTAGVWETGPPAPVVAGFGVGSIAFGADGTAIAVTSPGTGGSPLGSVAGPRGAWSPFGPVTTPTSGWTDQAVYPNGDVIVAAVDMTTVRVSELTDRPLPPLVIAEPVPVRLKAPARVPVGARATLTLTLSGPALTVPIEVQRRGRPGWRTILRTTSAASGPSEVAIPVRLSTAGLARLRVVVGAARAASAPRTIRVSRPARTRIPFSGSAQTIAAGPEGVWLLGTEEVSPSRATVSRIDPRTGRVAAHTTFDIAGYGRAPGGLAVGAGAVWVATADGVVRVDARSGVPTLIAIPQGTRSVAADASRVWAAGACDPSPQPIIELCHPRHAVSLDPATGALTGRQVSLQPKGSADSVTLAGRTLWLHGEVTDNYDNSVLASADPDTGAIRSGPREHGGRFGVPFTPLDATHVWVVRGTVSEVQPRQRSLSVVSPGFRARQAVRSGGRVWLLERRRATPRGGALRERLVEIALTSGRRTGRIVELGTTNDDASTFTIAAGVAWVLRPAEGTLLRIRLDRPANS